jgi:ABC-type antimicrobial peptide transport system permease subunit
MPPSAAAQCPVCWNAPAAARVNRKHAVGASWSSPAAELAVFTTVAIAAGVLAAIVPARRASRINVLNALQYE